LTAEGLEDRKPQKGKELERPGPSRRDTQRKKEELDLIVDKKEE